MMWAIFNSTLRRMVVGGCCIHMFQDEYSFNDTIESKFKECCPDEIGKNPLEYPEEQILDSLSERKRQQPEDVDHLRCSPIKTLR